MARSCTGLGRTRALLGSAPSALFAMHRQLSAGLVSDKRLDQEAIQRMQKATTPQHPNLPRISASPCPTPDYCPHRPHPPLFSGPHHSHRQGHHTRSRSGSQPECTSSHTSAQMSLREAAPFACVRVMVRVSMVAVVSCPPDPLPPPLPATLPPSSVTHTALLNHPIPPSLDSPSLIQSFGLPVLIFESSAATRDAQHCHVCLCSCIVSLVGICVYMCVSHLLLVSNSLSSAACFSDG